MFVFLYKKGGVSQRREGSAWSGYRRRRGLRGISERLYDEPHRREAKVPRR